MIKHLKAYLKHCSVCKVNQTRRHKLYENLQSILSFSISFHTLTIDFVLILSEIYNKMNIFMSITCKFFKRITIISEIDTWNASKWAKALLQRLNIADWNLLKIIISNRDRKFLSKLWSALFSQFDVKLLYFIAYHSQSNEASKRTNQILKIALRSFILTIDLKNWFSLVDALQREFNNASTFTNRSLNEICYEFTSLINFNFVIVQNRSNNSNSILSRMQIKNNIAHE